jgi:hypothetical protein
MQSLLDLSSLGGCVRKCFQIFGQATIKEPFKIAQWELASVKPIEPYNRVKVYSNLVGSIDYNGYYFGAAEIRAREFRDFFVWSQSFCWPRR